MPLILHLLVLISAETIMAAPRVVKEPDVTINSNINIFLTMAWQVANHVLPNSSCYVCGLMPFTAGEGLPLMALPASDCDTCQLMHIPFSQTPSRANCTSIKMRPLNCSREHTNCHRCRQPPKPVPVQLIPQPFPWCIQNDGRTPVGESNCLRTFKWDSEVTDAAFTPLNSAPEDCVKTAGQTRFGNLARRSASCSISSPKGMYWVCGNLAYPYLPVDYQGRCGLAYVIPAMRAAHSLPERAPQKRQKRGVSDIYGTHHQSPFKNSLGALLSFYGVMSALDQIADLSHAVEDIANATGRALTLISSELASVRLVALQNRAALDFLLAAQGGTCAVIGSECCTFVPEYNATIGDIVNHLHETAKSIHQDSSSSLFDWLNSTFGFHIYRFLSIGIVFIVFLIFFSSCVKKFLCNL